jgi:hypothetical protein
MTHRPLQFKPLPEGAVGARSSGPSTSRDVNLAAHGLPEDLPPRQRKPTVRRKPQPRPRGLFNEAPISLSGWSVDPTRIARDMGLG